MSKFNLAAVWSNNRGTSAVEFAMVAPVFIGLVVSLFYLCMGLFLVGSLHYAVEEGARCASLRTGPNQACKNASGIVSYAKSVYFGPSSPTFTYAATACGNSVSASVNYVANLGLKNVTIPITASSCFP
jgi:Flp pilus assembly protein TadG